MPDRTVPDRTGRPAAVVFLALAVIAPPPVGAALAEERPARSRLCPENLPEGARLPPQPGCSAAAPGSPSPRKDGFVDLGNGTSVRISGRTGVEVGARR